MGFKDRKNRSCLPRPVFLLWCTLVFLLVSGFTFSTLRLFSTREGSYTRLVSKLNIPAMEVKSGDHSANPSITIRETVIFPDQVLFFLKYPPSTALVTKDDLNCVYTPPNSSAQPLLDVTPSSIESGSYDKNHHQIVRCPLDPRGGIVSLAVKHNHGNNLSSGPTYRWNSLAYEAMIDQQDNSTIVFVKGLNLGSGKSANPSKFKCIYGSHLTGSNNSALWADAVSAAQEIVRCRTPLSVLNNTTSNGSVKVSVKVAGRKTLDSIARVKNHHRHRQLGPKKKHKICVCTMLRNQARFLPEWFTYHASIGIRNWFIYDNNSDDEIERVVESMAGENHSVTRVVWPWIKSQEAGFAHCALRARDSCEWVGFIDVDEFIHLPSNSSLLDVIDSQSKLPSSSNSREVGEIRVSCHDFGPSGLKEMPAKGVTVGYTCRMGAPERHKSIVRPEALNSSLINYVHHFQLKAGFRVVNLNRREVVINHYKYQVWAVFKEKFYRRVAAYVSDWQEKTNVGSKDRTPGLGTKPVEPADWSSRFCEVNDTGLRNRVLETFTDPKTGLLPWE
ncbi:hypothetical protein ABFS82_08G005500 [Erythranthe guttata]